MSDTINVKESVEEYITQSDWRVRANANQSFSVSGMERNIIGKVIANYWLDQVYTKEAGEAHRKGDIHIHDLDFLGGYCCGHSIRMLLQEGFNGVQGKLGSKPAKHLSAALNQMNNYLATMQNEWAGAQAFSSFDTYTAPFVYFDKLSYEEVVQCMQEFMFYLGTSSRAGGQTVFSNLTFDLTCPEDLKNTPVFIGGEDTGRKYGEFQKEMDMINLAFLEVAEKGDKDGRPFTFPIPTYNVTNDWNWDSPVADRIFEMTAKYGLPYFSNYLSSDMSPSDVRSMCCRLKLDLTELKKRGNGLFGSAEQTGSIGVITLNCARLGYLYKDNYEGLIKRIDELLEICKENLEIKRKYITEQLNNGLYPYTKRYLGTYRNFFSTVGVNGMNEMVLNYTNGKEDITTQFGQDLCSSILDHIRQRLIEIQEETGSMYNLEATPAEGATTRFAKADKKQFPGIIQAGTEDNPFYTNSSQLPVGFTDDIFEALYLQENLQTKYTGGTVLHLYMGSKISNADVCKKLIKKVLTTYKIPYLSITPTFSVCPKHGYLSGEHKYCPICDAEIKAQKLKTQK